MSTETYNTTVKVAKITKFMKVRAGGLNEARLEFFRGILSNGGSLGDLYLYELPDGNFELLGGNHRLQEYRNGGATEVPAKVICQPLDDLTRYRLAIEDNSGGSQPFTEVDLRHQIRQLIESGADTKSIVASFPSIPSKFVKSTMDTVKAMAAKAKATRGVDLVINHDYTVEEASTETGAPVASIKNALIPSSEKVGIDPLDVPTQMGAQGIAFRATSRRWSSWYASAEATYVEKGYGKAEIKRILRHQTQLLKAALNAVKEREKRVEGCKA